jgi:hypothetical protein
MVLRRTAPWLLLFGALCPSALGQSLDPERPRTLVVGAEGGPSTTERMDGRRTGLTRDPLPSGGLRVAWRRSIGPGMGSPPLVTTDGTILVFTVRGDLLELNDEGTEQARIGVGTGPVGPGTVLADGTVVTINAAGEAVGIFRSSVRFRTRVGDRGMIVKVAPLALEDGGVVVVNGVKGGRSERFGSEIMALDVEGRVRAHASVPEQVVWPLVSTDAGVAAVCASGTVYVWSPGGEPRRAGSFGGMLDGGAAAFDGSTLVGVVEATRLVAVDLVHGIARVVVVAAGGAAGAGAFLGPPSVAQGKTLAFELTRTSSRVAAFDAAGSETAFPVATFPLRLEADGSPAPIAAPVHTAMLADASGTVAFGAPDGHVGVVTASGLTELGEVICLHGPAPATATSSTSVTQRQGPPGPGQPSAGFAGLASAGAGAFLVACEAGSLLEVKSDKGR